MEQDKKVAQMPSKDKAANPNEFALDAAELEALSHIQGVAQQTLNSAQARAEGMLQGALHSIIKRYDLPGDWAMMPDRPGVLVKR